MQAPFDAFGCIPNKNQKIPPDGITTMMASRAISGISFLVIIIIKKSRLTGLRRSCKYGIQGHLYRIRIKKSRLTGLRQRNLRVNLDKLDIGNKNQKIPPDGITTSQPDKTSCWPFWIRIKKSRLTGLRLGLLRRLGRRGGRVSRGHKNQKIPPDGITTELPRRYWRRSLGDHL